jgi:hypothetical protein
LLFTYPQASIKDDQATEEAFSPQREHPVLKKMKFIKNFYFCGAFLPFRIRVRIANPDTNPWTPLNPDPIRIRIQIHNTGKIGKGKFT